MICVSVAVDRYLNLNSLIIDLYASAKLVSVALSNMLASGIGLTDFSLNKLVRGWQWSPGSSRRSSTTCSSSYSQAVHQPQRCQL